MKEQDVKMMCLRMSENFKKNLKRARNQKQVEEDRCITLQEFVLETLKKSLNISEE